MQKQELHPVDKLEGKEDRAIQFRSTAYNAALASYLWQIEHRMFELTHNGHRWCAKGLDKEQRAVLLLEMSDDYQQPAYVLADHSRFDAHVNSKLLKQEHKVYKKAHRYDPGLQRLLDMQCNNYGRTKGGIRYRCKGKRMSGDINTALGNSLLNLAMLCAWLKDSGVQGNILLDGDDSIVVVEKADLPQLIPIATYMLQFGMVTEHEVVHDVSKAEFCQSRIVLGPRGPYFGPNPLKALDKIRRSPMPLDSKQVEEVLRSSITCEMVANPNMPMLRPMADWLRAHPGTIRLPKWLEYRATAGYGLTQAGLEQVSRTDWQEPTLLERISFYRAWGFTPAEQLAFETTVTFTMINAGGRTRTKARPSAELPPPLPDELDWDLEGEQGLQDAGHRWVDATEAWRQSWLNQLSS
jgi:hypothetical protein